MLNFLFFVEIQLILNMHMKLKRLICSKPMVKRVITTILPLQNWGRVSPILTNLYDLNNTPYH